MAEQTSTRGIVLTRYGATVEVMTAHGTTVTCHQRKAKHPVIAGDHVIWRPTAEGGGIIEQQLPRKNVLAQRKDHKHVKTIAANLDQIVIAFTVKPHYDQTLIDRYIAVSELQGITPVLLATKMDLVHGEEALAIDALSAMYRAIGYTVVHSSQLSGEGLSLIGDILKNKTSVLVGQSGVGKSSLANLLLPEAAIKTAELTTRGELGSHTTSRSTLYPLPAGGYLVDSPGVRDFAVWEISAAELANGYIEFRPYLGQCRFNDCQHINEPDCAIKQAVAAGTIHPARYQTYTSCYEAIRAQTDQGKL